MKETVWLSGSRGFVGSYVIGALLNAGYDVKCVSNSRSNNVNIIHIDFSKVSSIRNALKTHNVPDTFIHLGWGSVYEPHHICHINQNVQDGINLIDELYNAGVKRFVLVGSSSEYGDRTGALQEGDSPMGELNNYVKGKLALAKYGLDVAEELDKIFTHVRLFYTYGAGQQHNSLINQLFQTSLLSSDMSLSPCEHFRDYIHVSEAAEGIARIASVDRSGVINLGSGRAILLKQFVKLLWSKLDGQPERLVFGSHEVPLLEQNQPKSYADLTRLKKMTNWVPTQSIEDGIKNTVEQLRSSN